MAGMRNARALRKVLSYLHAYKLRLGAGLLATVAASSLGAVQPLLMRQIIDETIPGQRWGLLALLTVALALIPVARLGLSTLQTLWINGTAQQVVRQLRVELLDHLLRMPLAFFNTNKTGELMTRVTNDTGRLAMFVSDDLAPVAANAIQLLILIGMLLYLDLGLAVAVIIIFPIFHLLGKRIGRRLAVIEDEWRSVRGQGSGLLQEILAGVRTIKSFTREKRESQRWADWNTADARLWLRRTNWSQVLAAANQAMVSIGVAIVMGYGGWQVATGRMTLGTLLAFFAYTPQFYATCGALITAQVEIDNLETYMARVFDILDTPPEPLISEPALHLGQAAATPGCELIFDQVSFRYGGDRQQGISDLSFQVAPGEFVAFVGPSGGGKSTILDLLMGFYRPDSGTIRLDQRDLSEWSLTTLRRQVAIVSQDVHVWNDTIRANLLYANDRIDETQMMAAVEAAQLAGFIAGLPQGYETIVGERGVRLSGGERQRLSIARALLRQPRLLLLDEVTAALDALTEKALQETVRPFLEERTVLAVAHRLASIMAADWIIVIDAGQIVQIGSPTGLREEQGIFQEMLEAQFDYKA